MRTARPGGDRRHRSRCACATDFGREIGRSIFQRGGNDTAIFDFRLVDATITWSGNRVIIDTATSYTVLTGFQSYVLPDGTVEEDDGNPLVADLFYYACNHDVWSAQVDTDGHFSSSGWREGRDPGAYFDTSLYLDVNPDVRAAGVDPLARFHSTGWLEGRRK